MLAEAVGCPLVACITLSARPQALRISQSATASGRLHPIGT